MRGYVIGLIGAALTLLTPGTRVVAHPGHGHAGDGHSLLHYLTEPLHLLPMVLAAAAMLLVVFIRRRVRRNRAAQQRETHG